MRYFRDLPVRSVVESAAAAWGGLKGVPELQISDGEPGPRGFDARRGATNGVYLIEDWELANSSLAVTVATFESRSGKIVDTDILVNAEHPFGMMLEDPESRGKAFDLHAVMTHEMGHVLGLGESFDVRLASMWPNIARGETHQRDIYDDDAEGAEEAYSYEPLSSMESPAGCAGSSVVMHRAGPQSGVFWMLCAVVFVVAGLWLRSRTHKGLPKGVPALAFVFLFSGNGVVGAPESDFERVEVVRTLALRHVPRDIGMPELARKVRSSSRKVRLAAAAVLERIGTRDDQTLASRLATDEDPEVRRAGRLALERLRTAPPATRILANTPEAKARLRDLLADAREVVEGEVVTAGVNMRNGLIWSQYLVHAKDRVVEVEIPGGTLGEYTQVISEQEAPADGDRIVVALRDGKKPAWAHLRDGVVYGGFLGNGPAIEWRSP